MSNQINLINDAYRVHRHRLNAAAIAGAGVAVYLGCAVANAIQGSTIEPLRSRLATAEGDLGQAKAELEAAIAGTKKVEPNKQLIEEVKRMEARLELQRELLVALETGGIGNTEGFSKYLTALARRRVDGVWLTGISITAQDGQISLTGRMVDPELMPVYIRELKSDDTLRGQGFGGLEMITQTVEVPVPGAARSAAAAKTGTAAPTTPEKQKVSVVQFRLGATGPASER